VKRGMVPLLACSHPVNPEVGNVYAQPNPTPLAQLIRSESTVAGHRNLYCFHYDACLDVAVKDDWDSWSCEKCPLFAEHEEPREFAGFYANERRGGVQP
jgi:hypothetical protein